MSNTALAVIAKELKANEVMAKISASLGKSATDPGVLKFIHGAIMEIEARVGSKSDITLCTKQSIIDSLIKAATVKLPVDSRQLAYLVPFGKTCTFMPSYKGYIYKVKEADTTMETTVGIVYKGDVFTCQETDNTATYEHKPLNPFEDNPKNIVGAYCYMKSSTGSWIYRMSNAELLKVKAQSKMVTGLIWNTWELEQFKKSIVRRAYKTKFTEAIAELDALDNKLFNDRPAKEIPKLADTAPLPAENVMEAEVVDGAEGDKKEPAGQESPEDLEKKAQEARERKAALEAEEAAKSGDVKKAVGAVSWHTKPNAGGYVSYAVEGYQTPQGKDMMFATKDPAIIKALDEKMDSGEKVQIDYKTVINGDYTNYNIVAISPAK